MTFTLYPAIDLRAGNVVRLKEGDPTQMTSYSDDPAQTARRWLSLGARWLHVVNLDGAFAENDWGNQLALREILDAATELGAQVQFGGGLRSIDDIQRAIDLSIHRVVLGTLAIERPEVVASALTRFGAERVAVGIDARDGIVQVRGWKDNSRVSALDLALQMRTLGLRTVIFTDIRRDGLGSGLNLAATCELADVSGLDVITSGGVNTLSDVIAARDVGLSGVIIGRALYEGTIDLKDALKTSVVE
ncbi:MAG TPA: 1-(5-phosphoribosyl)-5-[(5-phosphoribosylamino)methylideneamino]imidazole-4-carboxamide isomerase [Anaerolineales bacterium]|nr:1-(5-phosphoribosyl)-5-[(5-phosphoribosylamino)methylideneamino]imidazole-4-carboxamide isomerase [Anaerolineales bacterium]